MPYNDKYPPSLQGSVTIDIPVLYFIQSFYEFSKSTPQMSFTGRALSFKCF